MSKSVSGSAPRSSEGIYKTVTKNASNIFSPNKASAPRLLSVPKATFDAAPLATVAAASAAASSAVSSGSSFWRYLFILFIIAFLLFNLLLFLIKPADKDITHLYDPVILIYNLFFKAGGIDKNKNIEPSVEKPSMPALNKLENTLQNKDVVNNIDNKQTVGLASVKNYKKLPVIPEADDATSATQMKPASKAGFCYIGEDRGFRSCINVKDGDVCMSGDIFPTEAICINPNLRGG